LKKKRLLFIKIKGKCVRIQFLGATQTVTGSKYLLQAGRIKLLVDCGLFQGHKELRLRNWAKLPIKPADIDYVCLTHAHIDHSGYIPLLVKQGFRGKILCSEATRDLCEILLPDSGYLHEEEARYANRKGYSKHHPALPLYTKQDAEEALAYFDVHPFEKPIKLAHDVRLSLHYAGHILGASLVRISHHNVSILFSGDLGRTQDPVMYPPNPPPASDYYVIESTYGDRLHETVDPEQRLGDIITRTASRGGIVLIPSFAVGRAQAILFHIHQLKNQHKIPDIPVFVDSPMATDTTKLFYQHAAQHRLSKEESAAVCHTATYVQSVDESIALTTKKMPMIIISASGMATGGRVLHHIKNFAPDHRNAIVFAGFQAGGTRGDRMVRGESAIKMFGKMIPIRADVTQLQNTSAHADYKEMLDWLGQIKHPPQKVFITHGENQASEALQAKIEEKYHWKCIVPAYRYEEELR
jgi:metallo-beta-lactamase family protein